MQEMRILKFYLNKSHPDFKIAKHHSEQARILYNGMNALVRESQRFYRDGDLGSLPISHEVGVVPWVTEGVYPGSYYNLVPIEKAVSSFKSIDLPAKVRQGVSKSLAWSWESCISLRKKAEPSGDPSYKKKYCLVQYTSQAISKRGLSNGWVVPTQWKTGFKLPQGIEVSSARLYHSHKDVFVLEVLHKVDITPHKEDGIRSAIDLGVNKVATITLSDGSQPLTVDGAYVKSLNQGANRNSAKREVKNKKAMWKKRNRRIGHYFHSASSSVIKTLLERGVNELVIGWNEGFKDSPKMGRKNNQRFTSLPLARFRDMLTYKATQNGIRVTLQEESYTSKASFLDSDPLPVYSRGTKNVAKFSGKRTSRGMYKSKDGTMIHADVNGSYNILRKSNPSFRWSSGMVVMPVNLKFAY